MAFMVPVVKKEWDIYGSSANAKSGRRSGRSRTTSETSQQNSVSRGPSFGSRSAAAAAASPLSCSSPAEAGGWPRLAGSGRYSRSSSRGSNLSQTACSPPSRGVTFAASPRRSSQPAAGSPAGQSAPGSFSGFHTKVVDRMMRALHIADKDDSRKS